MADPNQHPDTVKVKSDDPAHEGGFFIINKADFLEGVHELFEEIAEDANQLKLGLEKAGEAVVEAVTGKGKKAAAKPAEGEAGAASGAGQGDASGNGEGQGTAGAADAAGGAQTGAEGQDGAAAEGQGGQPDGSGGAPGWGQPPQG